MAPEMLHSKKRMMFLKSEDFNYLTYCTLLLANELGCVDMPHRFVDHRKVAFLIDFIAEPRLIEILHRYSELNAKLNDRDRHELTRAYANGVARVHLITRLTFALEHRGLIDIQVEKKRTAVDFFLNADAIPQGFLSDGICELERSSITFLRQTVGRLRMMKLDRLLDKLFSEKGLVIWHG